MKKLVLLFFMLLSVLGFSQTEDSAVTVFEGGDAPTVGLVLSGGGAKGLAHIGVLKVLEEAGVKIDYIGGTSMGAIVGGLYSAGYSATQLDSIFQVTNFNILLQDEIPRSAKSFHEKKSGERYALALPFDNFDISFPSGLSKGQNVYNLMSRLTLHLEDKNDFAQLPIPFFCVAVDIETGEEVILDSGYLPQAIAASAAIPTLLSPVLLDERVLVDGGVVNNYPVEELKRRGVDIIIGVDVQDELVERDELNSVFQILTQIGNFRTVEDMKDKIVQTDIYIDPVIKPFNVTSFNMGDRIIKAGTEAAEKHFEDLKKIAVLQKGKERAEPRDSIPISQADSLYISDIRINGEHSYPRAYILGKLNFRYPEKISYKEFDLGINHLSATGNFRKIDYELRPLNKGYVLVLDLEENPNKAQLRMALHYDDLYKSGALVNYTRKSLLFSNDVTSFDLILGDNSRYNFEYYLDKGFYWSLGIKSAYNSFEKDMGIGFLELDENLTEIDVNRIAVEFSDVTNQFYIETLFEQVFSLGAGVEHKFLQIDSETFGGGGIRTPVTIFDKSHYLSSFGYLRYDSYDNKYFPSNGFYFVGDFHFYFLASDFNRDFSEFSIAKGEFGYAKSLSSRFSTRISAGTGFHIGNHRNSALNFFLGGYGNDFINNIVPFFGYDFLELSANSYIKGMVELDYEVYPNNHFLASASYANVAEDLYSTGNWFSTPKFSGYSLGYGLETFLGPLEVRYSYSPEIKESHWFFTLGFWF